MKYTYTKKSYCCGLFNYCMPPKVEIDAEQAQLLAKEEREGAAENAIEKQAHFKKILIDKLMKIYDSCKKLTPDAKPSDWGDWFKEVAADAVKVAGGAALGATLGVFTAKAVGKGEAAKEVAISTGLAGALCALWDVQHDHTMRDKAKGFLSLVEDVKLDRKKIEERMADIAEVLAKRFEFAIHRLRNSEEGIGNLANFFAVAIAKGLPDSPESQKMSVTSGNQMVPAATTKNEEKSPVGQKKLSDSSGSKAVSTSAAGDAKKGSMPPTDHSRASSALGIAGAQPSVFYPPQHLKNTGGVLSEDVQFRIAAAIKYAIPEKEDSLYKKRWRNIQLETADPKEKKWTIRGLLLGSPLRLPHAHKKYEFHYFIRDGKITKMNRADKYPPQVIKDVKEVPVYYLKVKENAEQMIAIINEQLDKDPVTAQLKRVMEAKRNDEAAPPPQLQVSRA